MAYINKVTIIGNIGRAPELQYMASGTAVLSLSVATTRTWKNKESGERQEETEWHRVVVYDKKAEVIGEYFNKGDPIYIEGRLKTRKWQDKEGRDVYTTEIIAEEFQFIGGRREQDNGGQEQQSQQPARQPQQSQQPARRAAKSSTGFDDMDDDIPF